ncbi:MAG: AI-2E family transporter, partial [Candidatus Nanoarchaeia archaeon]
GVIYGSLVIALIQGALGALGFMIFGVGSPILWGLVMSLFALVPFIGTPIIWGPAGLLLVIDGFVDGQTNLVAKGIGLLIYGTLVISTVDNILKPKLIGKKAKIHPIVVLIGVLGGLSLLGFVGFVVGPLVLALFEALIEVYEKEKRAVLK